MESIDLTIDDDDDDDNSGKILGNPPKKGERKLMGEVGKRE